MIKAILMDFNGVIIDDEPIQMRVYQELLAAEDVVVTDEDYYSSLGMDDKTFVRAAFERAGRTADDTHVLAITQAKTEKWREIVADELPLFDDIENFIRKMANDFTLGIVSMSARTEIDLVLEQVGIADLFSVIVSAGDVTNCKPDPECYRTAFRQIDLNRIAAGHLPMTHSDCLAIEDSPPGVLAARNAGLPVLGVTNTVSAGELRSAGADWIAKDLNDWMPDSVRRVFV